MVSEEVKQHKGKIPLGNLLDFRNALREVSKVREYGNKKYSDINSYKSIPNGLLIDATLRHIFDAVDEPVDEESGVTHLAHAIVNLLMIIEKNADVSFSEQDSLS